MSKASIEALISGMGLKLLQFRELDVEIVGGSYTLFQIALRVN